MRNRQQPLKTFAGLVKALDWYDVSLQTILEELGLEPVNRTQSMILTHIASGVTRPTDIAREMGTTRQNIHAMARLLVDRKVLKLVPDQNDKRSKQYAFSEDAMELRDTVLRVLSWLDKKLADRIGPETMAEMQRALTADWGDYITEPPARLK
ncbi:MAG: MarR family transcriptional regulator [Pseudomonadales bacterium]|nr:MarR family transcriptional regulator [Pseudomonadales bacterium]